MDIMMEPDGQLVWLSHDISADTPLYGGTEDIKILPEKSMAQGDSCNTARLVLPGHAGTHVDAPRHFVPDGVTVDAYGPASWIFRRPLVVHLETKPGTLIGPDAIAPLAQNGDETDLLLLRTGFQRYRKQERYWKNGPGLDPALLTLIASRLPRLSGIGLDCISISSLEHREAGRAAHKAFLGAGLRLFEDMDLSALKKGRALTWVMALPLRVRHGDGAPCTIVGRLGG